MVNGNKILNSGNHVFHGDVDASIILYTGVFIVIRFAK